MVEGQPVPDEGLPRDGAVGAILDEELHQEQSRDRSREGQDREDQAGEDGRQERRNDHDQEEAAEDGGEHRGAALRDERVRSPQHGHVEVLLGRRLGAGGGGRRGHRRGGGAPEELVVEPGPASVVVGAAHARVLAEAALTLQLHVMLAEGLPGGIGAALSLQVVLPDLHLRHAEEEDDEEQQQPGDAHQAGPHGVVGQVGSRPAAPLPIPQLQLAER
mmetsp:Transcript_29921/g.90059  ORF Transcript_29921/g.90059 Transcript_29921/m.90059 type:complete len:218 (-) Transcript_29921:166-819(-)